MNRCVPTHFRHARESGPPVWHRRDAADMDSRLHGNDGASPLPAKRKLRVILALLRVAAGPILAATPLSRMDLPWWRERFEAKQTELRQGRVELVFYGDSITQDYERGGPEPW